MKVVELKDGKRFVWTNIQITEHGNPVVKEFDIRGATLNEVEALKNNPHNDNLIAEIQKRG